MRFFSRRYFSTYDFVVVGGGSGGLASAKRAAEHGARVLLVEKNGISGLGGTCVNLGCVPKKIMTQAGGIFESLRNDLTPYGFEISKVSFDFLTFKKRRDEFIKKLNSIYKQSLDRNENVEFREGFAKFVENTKKGVKLEINGDVVETKNCLLAPGTKPKKSKNFENLDFVLDSDQFFSLEKLPQRVAILGSGYIAVEFAGILKNFGCEVVLCVRKSTILKNFDEMLQISLIEEMKKKGIEIEMEFIPEDAKKENNRVSLFSERGRKIEVDLIVSCIGRVSNFENLGLEKVGVQFDNYVTVDEFSKTSNDKIYAVGDCIGKANLTPVAVAAGRRVADNLFFSKNEKLDYSFLPTVIFSNPPIGTCGMTEREARDFYEDVETYESSFRNLFYSLHEEKPTTRVKLVCRGVDKKILGAHMIGKSADEILQGIAVAIKMGATKSDFDKCFAIHPTAAEEFVTLPPWGL